jgi:nucleoside-diphosphate-sugar epimerase
MALLVTGGTGFLGSYFTRHAIEEGGEEHVVVLEKHVDRSRVCDILDRVTIIEGDVANEALLRAVMFDHGIDRVAHFAFILGSPSAGHMRGYVDVQCAGTASLLEAAREGGVRRVLFASSVAAYGKQAAAVLSEDLVPDPQDLYGSCKVWGEALARHYRTALGLETVSLRFGSTYGLGRAWRGSYSSGLLNPPSGVHYMARVEEACRGRPVTMPAGHALADWTYAADAAQAAWLALTAAHLPNHLYNVSAQRLPIGRFTEAMRRLLPHAEIAESPTEPPGHAHPPMDNARLVADLGFAPRFDLEAGLADYIERIRAADAFSSGR